MNGPSFAIDHLLLRLRVLNRVLRGAVERQRCAAERFARPGLAALCITDEHVAALLDDVEALSGDREEEPPSHLFALNFAEVEAENELRDRAAAGGTTLPLDALSQSLGLLPFEAAALLICGAPEIDRCYQRIYGYVLDDLNRQQPCVELICMLAAGPARDRLELRRAIGRFGRLRRAGILQAVGESAVEARQELRLAPALLDFMLGSQCEPAVFRDRAEVEIPDYVELPPDVDSATIERLAKSIKEKRISVVGVWGPRHCAKDDVLLAVSAASRIPLRRYGASGPIQSANIPEAFETSAALGAAVWFETDILQSPEYEVARDALADLIANSSVPVFLTGTHPWRPPQVLASRGYIEFELSAPGFETRKSLWSKTAPDVTERHRSELAGRFRLSHTEMRAAVQFALAKAELKSNGHRAEMPAELDAACATVTRRRSDHFASVVKPRRTADDLVLPDDVHKQVVEIAQFFRASAMVDEEWGFGRMAGAGGIKALFTGMPGTGKTLAAEVIAGMLALPLLKVDLARVVSKWVGETEKNLDVVFREAEESHAVLFFDEADSLFGKRGEVQHGTDRYANLEVGFLLQRLEEYFGLVILASNLKDQIDPAFTRRFHVIVHFPFPQAAERLRIWKLAFPPNAPTESEVDFATLQKLDMTGAAIVSAARTAALLAADGNGSSISMEQVIRGIARQYRREARLLAPSALGPYGHLLQGPP